MIKTKSRTGIGTTMFQRKACRQGPGKQGAGEPGLGQGPGEPPDWRVPHRVPGFQ